MGICSESGRKNFPLNNRKYNSKYENNKTETSDNDQFSPNPKRDNLHSSLNPKFLISK